MAWQIVADVLGKNPGEQEERNEGGVVIYVEANGRREEVERVAFVRENSANPEVSFDDQVEATMAKARRAIAVVEELSANAGTLQ